MERLSEFLSDWGIRFVPSSAESAQRAGRMFAEYLRRGGRRGRVVPDFIIGAHALTFSDRLLARDEGFRRDYFAGLSVTTPANPQP